MVGGGAHVQREEHGPACAEDDEEEEIVEEEVTRHRQVRLLIGGLELGRVELQIEVEQATQLVQSRAALRRSARLASCTRFAVTTRFFRLARAVALTTRRRTIAVVHLDGCLLVPRFRFRFAHCRFYSV